MRHTWEWHSFESLVTGHASVIALRDKIAALWPDPQAAAVLVSDLGLGGEIDVHAPPKAVATQIVKYTFATRTLKALVTRMDAAGAFSHLSADDALIVLRDKGPPVALSWVVWAIGGLALLIGVGGAGTSVVCPDLACLAGEPPVVQPKQERAQLSLQVGPWGGQDTTRTFAVAAISPGVGVDPPTGLVFQIDAPAEGGALDLRVDGKHHVLVPRVGGTAMVVGLPTPCTWVCAGCTNLAIEAVEGCAKVDGTGLFVVDLDLEPNMVENRMCIDPNWSVTGSGKTTGPPEALTPACSLPIPATPDDGDIGTATRQAEAAFARAKHAETLGPAIRAAVAERWKALDAEMPDCTEAAPCQAVPQ